MSFVASSCEKACLSAMSVYDGSTAARLEKPVLAQFALLHTTLNRN